MYKVSFLDRNGEEFMGTTEHFSTDGRYNYESIDEVARDEARRSLKRDQITGYVIRRGRFSNPVIRKVIF
jgi:hypothetical protein